MHLGDALQAELEATLASDSSLPGIIATVRGPRLGLDWSGACGAVNLGATNGLTTHHAFRVASVTKPFTAAVALRLFELDQLSLFAPIEHYLQVDVRTALRANGYAPDRITFYHLLTHSSGMRDHAGRTSNFISQLQSDPTHQWTHEEQIAQCMDMGGPLSEPGTHFFYSDTAYVILGDLLEHVTGQPLHTLMRELLKFDEQGLNQTHFERYEETPPWQHRAGQYLGTLDVSTIDCSADLSGGGGLISTTDELATFMRALALGEVFDRPETLSIGLTTPSLVFVPQVDSLHSALMRGRFIGREPAWMHGGAWGVSAGYCPACDMSWAVSFNQVLANQSTLGITGNFSKTSLVDRLALIVQRAAQPSYHN